MSNILSTLNPAVADYLTSEIKVKSGELKYKTSGHTVTWENLTTKLTPQRLSITPEQFDEAKEVLIEAYNLERESIAEGEYFSDPLEFCEHFFKEWGVEVGGDDCITWNNTDAGKVPITVAQLVGGLKIELYNYDRNIPVDPETGDKVVAPLKCDGLLQPSVERLVRDVKYKAIGRARDAIKYNPNTKFNLDRWVEALLDVYGIDYRATPSHVTMFKHLLYNIKRGVFHNRDKELHPMFVFYSRKQGTGKTTLLEKLCAPFPYAYSGNGILAKLLEGKAAKAMLRGKALVDFQELATPKTLRTDGAGGAIDTGVMAQIKQAITTPVIEDRGLYTAENEKEAAMAAFASSSNIHIFDILQDPGGMRRYWEFELVPTLSGKEKWDRANKLFSFMKEVYQCIDEEDSMGFFHDDCEHIKEIERIQENYSKEDAFSKFCILEGIEVQGFAEEGYVKTTLPKLTKRFCKHQERQGNRSWTTHSIIMLMSQKDILPDRIEENGKVVEYVYVKEKEVSND